MCHITAIFLGIMGIMVACVAFAALREAGMFGRLGRSIGATCVGLLSIAGLMMFFDGGQTAGAPRPARSDGDSLIHGILIPYASLALSLLLILIIRIGQVCFRRMGLRRDREDRLVGDGRRKKPDEAGSRLTKRDKYRE